MCGSYRSAAFGDLAGFFPVPANVRVGKIVFRRSMETAVPMFRFTRVGCTWRHKNDKLVIWSWRLGPIRISGNGIPHLGDDALQVNTGWRLDRSVRIRSADRQRPRNKTFRTPILGK